MLTEDVRFEGWDTRDWLELLALFRRLRPPSRSGDAPAGGVVAVEDDGRLVKLLSTRAGRLDPRTEPWPATLPELAARHGARFAVKLQRGALEELMERFAARATPDDDILVESLAMVSLARELALEGKIVAHPLDLAKLTVPSARVVSSTLLGLCPDGKVIAVVLFSEGRLETSVALRRRGRGFDLVLGPEPLRAGMGLLSGDFRRDHRYVTKAIEESAGELATGLFLETSMLRRLLADPAPGAWARAVAVRDVVVSPMSAAAMLPLAIDAFRGVFHTARTVTERYDPTGMLRRVVPDEKPARRGTLVDVVRGVLRSR